MNDFVRCISSSSSLGFVPLRLCGLWICAVYRFLSHDSKVDEAYVDTSSSMKLSNRWIRALEAWAGQQVWIKTKEIEIFEVGVEEGVDLGPMWCYRGELFYHSMLCKWTTSLANFACHLPMKTHV